MEMLENTSWLGLTGRILTGRILTGRILTGWIRALETPVGQPYHQCLHNDAASRT